MMLLKRHGHGHGRETTQFFCGINLSTASAGMNKTNGFYSQFVQHGHSIFGSSPSQSAVKISHVRSSSHRKPKLPVKSFPANCPLSVTACMIVYVRNQWLFPGEIYIYIYISSKQSEVKIEQVNNKSQKTKTSAARNVTLATK